MQGGEGGGQEREPNEPGEEMVAYFRKALCPQLLGQI